MKTPIYETSVGATLALLETGAFVYADLYTITTVQGPVLRYTSADSDIAYGGNTWSSKSVRIDTDKSKAVAHWKVGLDVDTWQVVLFPRARDDVTGAAYPDQIGSVPWLAAACGGALSGAVVTVDRAYLPAWYTPEGNPFPPTGVLRIFAGRVAEVDLGRSGAVLTINSHLELLNVQMPRNLFQAGCRHTLFDGGCTLVAASYAVSGTAGSGSTRATIFSGVSAPAGSGTYTLGRLVFTSGLNAGYGRSIRSWATGIALIPIAPFPFNVAPGDAFTAYPGCDKQLSTCQTFGNQVNFGGQPFIPAPETST